MGTTYANPDPCSSGLRHACGNADAGAEPAPDGAQGAAQHLEAASSSVAGMGENLLMSSKSAKRRRTKEREEDEPKQEQQPPGRDEAERYFENMRRRWESQRK